jgi:glucose-6-phosphate-specific signal transduction histidine kinase
MTDPMGVDATADTLRRVGGLREALGGSQRRSLLRALLLALAYAVFWLLAASVSRDHWFLPAGLRFAVLWLEPPRRWGWYAVADAAAIVFWRLLGSEAPGGSALLFAALLPWCSHALAVALTRSRGVYAAPESPARMGKLLAAMLLAAALNATVQSGSALIEARIGASDWLASGFTHLIGHYVGMLVLVPIALQLLQPGSHGHDWRRMVLELFLTFVPLFALMALLLHLKSVAALYAGVLVLFPTMLLAFRHGWRGAAWALTATSLALYVGLLNSQTRIAGEVLQLFLAIVGSIALLLGAAIGALRRVYVALIERNRQDQAANARLADQTEALRDLSRRLVRARDDEQRRLAYELHDELGQSVAALGTRLSLMLRKTEDPEQIAALRSQRELVQRIQVSIREVLQGLRPAILDRFGLEAALREGPIQRLLADAGVGFEVDITGPVERVGSDTGSAVYRICQEAATNCVKHAQAWNFRLQLDVAPAWGGDLEVHLRLEDDGRGFDHAASERESLGGGLRGIRDRVLALAGEYRCESGAAGTRHLAWFVDRAPRDRGGSGEDPVRSS